MGIFSQGAPTPLSPRRHGVIALLMSSLACDGGSWPTAASTFQKHGFCWIGSSAIENSWACSHLTSFIVASMTLSAMADSAAMKRGTFSTRFQGRLAVSCLMHQEARPACPLRCHSMTHFLRSPIRERFSLSLEPSSMVPEKPLSTLFNREVVSSNRQYRVAFAF